MMALTFLQLFMVQSFYIIKHLFILCGVIAFTVEKFGRCNAQILTDIEKTCMRWKTVSIFQRINITGALPE